MKINIHINFELLLNLTLGTKETLHTKDRFGYVESMLNTLSRTHLTDGHHVDLVWSVR